jgi:hypothetical protein
MKTIQRRTSRSKSAIIEVGDWLKARKVARITHSLKEGTIYIAEYPVSTDWIAVRDETDQIRIYRKSNFRKIKPKGTNS